VALLVVAVVVLLTGGCATRGQVRAIRTDLANVTASLASLEAKRTAELENTPGRAEVKAIGTQVSQLEARISATTAELGQVTSRLDSTERVVRDTAAAVDQLTTAVGKLSALPAAPTPPPSPPRDGASRRSGEAAEQVYVSALAAFRAREHGQAVLDFLDFLGRYPKHPLAPNAQYWIGEAYFLQKDYRQAAVEFDKVLEHGVGNPKAADALLRLGMCYRNLRESTRATETLKRVIRDYPSSDAATKARSYLAAKN
jgi:tol-pal system protein YbgF